MKKWTTESVQKHLESFDYEAAKKWEYALSYYLDIDEETSNRVAIYAVMEQVRPDEMTGGGGNVVQATAHSGWRSGAYEWLKGRKEYGDVGDHSLLTDQEAQTYLDPMGLRLEDGKQLLIDGFKETNGHAPIILPKDPNFQERRDRAKKYHG